MFVRMVRFGRRLTFAVGAVVIGALLLGSATAALAAVPGDPLRLARLNVVGAITRLTAHVPGPALRITNRGSHHGAAALQLITREDRPPLKVTSSRRVARLNADKLDGRDASAFLPNAVYRVNGNYTLGSPDPRTNGKHAELSCDPGDMLLNYGWYTGSVNNPNRIQGANNLNGNTFELEWWHEGSSGGYVALTVICLDTAAPAHS